MGELERDTPTSRHIRPELLFGFGMVFPERSQVLRAYYQDIDDRRRRRAGEFEDELLDTAHCSPEEIIKRILADERAGDLFERAVHEALVAADKRKRLALARAVASGLLTNDEASIDEAQAIVRAIAGLEAVHVRALLVLAQPGDDGVSPHLPWSVDYLAIEIKASPDLAEALIAKLTAEGLAREAANVGPGGPPGRPSWEISDLGRRVLALLRADPPS